MHKSWLHLVQILTTRQSTEHYNVALQWEILTVRRSSSTKRDWSSTKGKKWNWHLRVIGHLPTKLKRITWGGERWKENWRKTGTKLHVHLKDTDTFRNQPKPKKKRLSNMHLSLEVTVWVSRKPLSTNLWDTGHGERHIFTFLFTPKCPPVCRVPLATGWTQILERGTTGTSATAALTSVTTHDPLLVGH